MTDRTLHSVDATETGVLELRNLAASRDRRFAARDERLVDHAFDDDRPRRVIGAGLGSQPEELHAGRVDVVLFDETNDGGRRHCVNAVMRSPDTKTAPDNLADLGPLVVGPATPVFQPHTVRRDVSGEAADSNRLICCDLIHGCRLVSPAILVRRALSLNHLLNRNRN